ncbi:MAG: lipid-A-disaccharide synthase [Neisseria sp.]|nr:lipid-A-disaccharide synthase [Neisseria sp.]
MDNNRPLRIGVVAGEASGDLLGAHLLEAIRATHPNCEIIGIGGPQMIRAGCNSLYPQEKLAVRGFVEVFKRLPEILSIRRGLLRQLLEKKLDVFIGIDAPDFNFGVEKRLKKAGIPTVHYVSPSVWAWRSGRVKKIVKIADTVLCLFPMEPELYRAAGGQAEFVGHPLAQTLPLEADKTAARETLKIKAETPVFTLMPGSRVSEIDYMAEPFLQAAEHIHREYPDALFLLPAATAATRDRLQTLLRPEAYRKLPLRLMSGHAQTAIIAADAVLVASGTATLEVALCKRPMVIAYRVSPVTFSLVKSRFKLPFVGLPNILLNRFAVPELLQDEANPTQLAAALLDWYRQPEKVAAVQQEFLQLHQTLRKDTAQLAADAVLALAKKSR